MDVFSLTSSAQSRFLSSSMFSSFWPRTVVWIVGRSISLGMTASMPYARAKGVFPVGRPGVVR